MAAHHLLQRPLRALFRSATTNKRTIHPLVSTLWIRSHHCSMSNTATSSHFGTKCSSMYYISPESSRTSTARQVHTTTPTKAFGVHEIADAMSQYPAIIALTGGGGVVAGLYRSPAFWKLIAKASADNSVLLLPQKPSHSFQTRKHEIQRLQAMFKSLRKQNGKNVSVAVYVTGRPGFGKTQLAREFGKEYYRKNKGFLFKNLFVGTLNAASKSSFLQSYITLALELGCASELKSLESLSGLKGELQSLELLSAAVRKELKKRRGWLLIVDNLSSEVKAADRVHNSINPPQTSAALPVMTPATVPFSPPGLGRDVQVVPFSFNIDVAAAYGVANIKAAWRSFWPQAGDESWGRGNVLITTHDRSLVERPCPSASELFLSEGMSEGDAISLLEKVSGHNGEGAAEVVNSLDKVPLSIASAGFYIYAEKLRNPTYSFRDYLSGLEKGIQAESEKMLLSQNLSYPVTMKMAVSMATRELASDSNLHKVFLLLASCAQSPVPMSLIARVLCVRHDINNAVLESVRNCALLFFPKSQKQELLTDDIESVSLYRGTRDVFRELMLGDSVATIDPSVPNPEVLPTADPLPHDSGAVQHRNDLLRHFIDCLVQAYESASTSDSVSSYRMRHLLLPHMEAHLQATNTVPGFHLDSTREVKLCCSIGSGYLLIGRPQRAREVLERALKTCETSGGKNSVEAANIASRLGTTYRHLAMQQQSELVLREALLIYEKQCGEDSIEVAHALNNLSSTYKYQGKYHESRKCLESALEIYEKRYDSQHPSVATSLTNLGVTLRSLGDSFKSKQLFEEALAIQEQLYEPQHPSIAVTLGNLSVSYSDLGQPQKSVELLQRALEITKHVHGPDHISVAITLSNLSIAYRHLGDVQRSKELAKEALRKTEAVHGPAHPGVAIALGILGSTYCDLGELTKARQLLENSVEINKAINGLRHAGTAISQTQLGRVVRLDGNLQDAKEILETALETKEMVHGKDHPGIAMTLNSLGKVYHELGYLTQSLQTLMRSQGIGQKFYCNNPSHPQIAFSEADLARVVRDCGDVEKSVAIMQQALDLYTSYMDESSNLGYTENHPKYASMLAIMGIMLRDHNKPKEAKKVLQKALRIQERILSQQSLMKAETICTLGTVLHRLGDRQKALASLDTALSMMKSVKYQHPVTSTISAAIAQLLLDMGEMHSAQASLEEALKIRSVCCGEIHPNVAEYHMLLGDIACRRKEVATEREHFQTAWRIYRFLHEREERLSQEAGIELPVLEEWKRKEKDLEQKL